MPFNPIGEQQVVPSPNFQPRYFFFNEERTSAYILDQGGLIFHTTDYDTFDPFSRALIEGLALVHEEVGLSNFDRIGVRCLDAVRPASGEKFSQYLIEPILGLSERASSAELLFSSSETRTKKGNRTLMSRTTIFNQEAEGAAFPQELQPVAIKLTERFAKVKGLYAVLDTDCWLEEKEQFDLNRVAKRLALLHDEVSELFRLLVTPHALKNWE